MVCAPIQIFIFDNGVCLPNCNECCCRYLLGFETFLKTEDRLEWIVSGVLRPIERFSA